MLGQLCVVDPFEGVGFGDGDAANTGDAMTNAAIAATATTNAIATLRKVF